MTRWYMVTLQAMAAAEPKAFNTEEDEKLEEEKDQCTSSVMYLCTCKIEIIRSLCQLLIKICTLQPPEKSKIREEPTVRGYYITLDNQSQDVMT